MRMWPWRKRREEEVTAQDLQVQKAEGDLLNSRREVDVAMEQEREAFAIAARLRDLQRRNHFAERMTLGIQRGLRE